MNIQRARERLAAVPDPEIPAVSLVELGIVRELRETATGLEVVLTPTYSGCPATELIADDVRSALAEFGDVTVTMQRSPAWTAGAPRGWPARRCSSTASCRRSAAPSRPSAWCPGSRTLRCGINAEYGSRGVLMAYPSKFRRQWG